MEKQDNRSASVWKPLNGCVLNGVLKQDLLEV